MYEYLINELLKNNNIMYGDFTLKSEIKSNVYFDLRTLISYPTLLNQVLEHCIYPKRVLEELRSVCNNNAIIEIKSPYANSTSALCELHHCCQFNRWSYISLGESNRFRIILNSSTPHRYIKWMPVRLLNFLSSVLNSIYVDIHVIIEVIKDSGNIKIANNTDCPCTDMPEEAVKCLLSACDDVKNGDYIELVDDTANVQTTHFLKKESLGGKDA